MPGSRLGGIHMSTAVAVESKAWYLNRWNQLILGVIAMMAISSPQYVWTLFTGPLNQKLGTTLAELQWTVSLLIILQTWFSPFQAYLVDRFGPRLLISLGALSSGAGHRPARRRSARSRATVVGTRDHARHFHVGPGAGSGA